jgi:hypothetical protein
MLRVLAVVIAAASPGAAAAHAGQGTPVAFRTVARGDGATSAVTERAARAVRSERAWRREWGRLNARVVPRPRLPRVDFARSMLIVVTAGRRPSGGHGITVTAIHRRGGRLVVRADERAPGRGCFTTAVLTAPFHVVRVRRTAARVTAARRRVTVECRTGE